jgi:hypothetical protein
MTSSNARIEREVERSLRAILRDHWAWWLLPMVGVWLLFLGLVWFTQEEQAAVPFLYSLF